MGILDIFRPPASSPGDRVTAALAPVDLGRTHAAVTRDPARIPLASPFSPDADFARIVWQDIFGTDTLPVSSRSAAMRLGPVIRGRNLLCGTIARFPLVDLRGAERTPIQPSWLWQTEDGSSPQHRMLWTLDDHLFHGWSLWHLRLGGDLFPTAATHINWESWDIDDDNQLRVFGSPVENPREWLILPGIHEGILTLGVDILRDARDLFGIVRERLENNTPPITLEAQPGAERLTPDEIKAVITTYKELRKANGGVGYSNEWLKATALKGNQDSDLLIEARNAAAVDLARLIGIHAGMIDATTPKASLNYETVTGRNQEFVDFDLALPMWAVTARLSLDDMTPHGRRVGFDLSEFTAPTPPPTGYPTED